MKNFALEGSLTTPSVNLNPEEGLIEIKGKSIPEDTIDFYQPLYDWLDEYSQNPQKDTTVNLAMEYFNTSSSKEFLKLLRMLEDLHTEGKSNVVVKWFHESDDEEMMDMGHGLQSDSRMPLEVIPIDEI